MKYRIVESIVFSLLTTELATAFSISGASCGEGKFRCDGFKCIPMRWVCDNSPDCEDQSDEQIINCPEGVTIKPSGCKESDFQCQNGHCLPQKWKCDGDNDCGDDSDEAEELCKFACSGDEFRCKNGQCIERLWKCDGHSDCSDLSDELECPDTVAIAMASSKTFKCDSAFTIPMKWRCDGSTDCADKTDEEDCEFLENEMVESLDKKKKNCLKAEFRCPNAFCIQKSWLCDGMNDCPNGEDESNCDKKPCEAKGEFRCLDGSGCVSKMVVCDGVNHCSDSSDEAGCPPKENMPDEGNSTDAGVQRNSTTLTSTTTMQPITTTKPVCDTQTHYLCLDDTCIPNSKLCDGFGDCKDRKDESVEVCGIDECIRNNGGCMHNCINTREGHECTCGKGYKLVGKYNCEDIDECTEVPGTCSQLCLNIEGGFRCSCLNGYLKDPADLTRCKAAEGDVYLLFSHSYDIRSLRLRDRDMISIVKDTRSAIALDFLFEEKIIMWSDEKDKKIYRASLTNTSSREVLASSEDIAADGLAVDWIHRNVYYTDTARSAINLLSWDAKHLKTIAKEDLGHPRAIAVAPMKGYVYWTDWGSSAKIERASLDGSERKAIVTYPHVVWPNGLTIDPSMDKIYWCDGRLRRISSANFDGTDLKVILYSPTFLRQPFSISVFEDKLYWTDWTKTALFSANKFTGADIQTVSAGHMLESPKVVHVFHRYRQPEGENICANHSCSQFCIRSPLGSALCACADEYTLGKDSRSCQGGEEETEDVIQTTPLTKLNPDKIEEENEIKNIEEGFHLYKEAERSSQVGFIIGGTFGVIFAIVVILALYATWTKTRQMPYKPFRFPNPVYRKTTSDDTSDARGFLTSQDEHLFTPATSSSSSLSFSEEQLTDADDAPLTPKEIE